MIQLVMVSNTTCLHQMVAFAMIPPTHPLCILILVQVRGRPGLCSSTCQTWFEEFIWNFFWNRKCLCLATSEESFVLAFILSIILNQQLHFMSILILERNLSSVDVRAVWAFTTSLTVLAAALGTEWSDDLDLRQPPQGCSKAEGQNVRKGLCKMLWLQDVCQCVSVSGCTCVHACVCQGKGTYQ